MLRPTQKAAHWAKDTIFMLAIKTNILGLNLLTLSLVNPFRIRFAKIMAVLRYLKYHKFVLCLILVV